MTLYHATSRTAAAAIVEEGFRETVDSLTRRPGVWFADHWIDYGSAHDAAVAVEIPDTDLGPYDQGIAHVDRLERGSWVRVPAEDYRVYLIPAAVANAYPRHALVTDTKPITPRTWKRSVGPALEVPKVETE